MSPGPCRVCHEPASVVCVGCGAVQVPPPAVEPFALFGMPRMWHLDLADLEARYRELARRVHPDRQGGKSSADRMYALQWTAAVNEARRILRDDIRRAWLLATGAPNPRERGVTLEPAFLAEMFEWREDDEASPGTFAARAAERAAAIRAEIDARFTAWESGQASLDGMEDALSRLKYVS